jgi:phosphoglucosamine mutase
MAALKSRKLFGTDGIRGQANTPPMTPELALRLGRAITIVAARGRSRPPRIVIGKDTRLSGYMLETALASGICAMGGRVQLCGPLPTPAVANITVTMRADAGLVISASHNPYDDNGIKIFGPDGFKLPDDEEAAIEQLLDDPILDAGATGLRVGRAARIDDAAGRYVVSAKGTFPRDLTLDGVKIVVDAANGAAYKVAPNVFAELGATVVSESVKPNGTNINRNCGALHPEHAAHEVLRSKAQLGIALDGDADRVIIIDEAGNVVDGDAVMALCGARLLRENRLSHNTVVATVMSNLGLERALESVGATLKRTAVGDRYVVEEMRKSGYSFGGEQSGHLVFLEHATTGDGIVAALQVLAVMVREQKPLSELVRFFQASPQLLESVKLPRRKPIEEMPRLRAAIGDAETKLGRDGRVLVRWSGTEAKLRVMVEGPDQLQLKQMVDAMIQEAQADIGAA